MRIEDRLSHQARRLRGDVDASVSPDDVESALDEIAGSAPAPRWTTRSMLLTAAAVVVLAAAVGAFVAGDDERLVADEGEPAPTAPETTSTSGVVPVDVDIDGEVLGIFDRFPGDLGSMAFLGTEESFSERWRFSTGEPAPSVDFSEQVVLTFTTARRCAEPAGLDQAGQLLRPGFRAQDLCDLVAGPVEYLFAVDRSDLPATFDLVLDSELLDGAGPYALTIDTSESSTSFTPPQPEPTGPPPPAGPDLERPAPGREITFAGIGDMPFGVVLGPSDFEAYEGGGSCGYWGPQLSSDEGDQPLGGLVSIDGDQGTVISIVVWENPRFRTASGVGVGTTLASLQRIYGDDLTVDRTTTQAPTDGLHARYHDVAAVRNGDRALTFTLFSDVVQSVKLSSAEDWGDDEGCA